MADEPQNLSPGLYEKRFWQRNDGKEGLNVVGYGVGNEFIPPIQKPDTVLEVYDKFAVTLGTNPIGAFWHFYLDIFLDGMAAGDPEDGYLYNNPEASGNQLYPTGLHKYYDMYSNDGFWVYVGNWFLYGLELFIIPFTFFPLSVILAFIDGLDAENFWYIFLYPIQYAWWGPVPAGLFGLALTTFGFSDTTIGNPLLLRLLDASIGDGWEVL